MKKISLLILCFVLLYPAAPALAKGTFSFITIKVAGVTDGLKVTDPALLGYFSFANFSNGPVTEVPQNPGAGYEIIRSYVDSATKNVQDFDHLHYYPDSGYVYFDGLINGSSEYDGKWYQADSKVKTIFLRALAPKGGFAYLTVMGQGLDGELTLTSETFVKDFFAFANFEKNKIDPPADDDPDFAFEISRFYIVDSKAAAFDKLVYYPDQGYVYYAAGEAGSPYIDQWFTASPEIEAPFRAALSERARLSLIPASIFVILLIIFGFIYFRASAKQSSRK